MQLLHNIRDLTAAGPRLRAPGTGFFATQPDGLWAYLDPSNHRADVICVESCGGLDNFINKRARYGPRVHGLVVEVRRKWLLEPIAIARGGKKARWQASGVFQSEPSSDIYPTIRHLAVLYALPDGLYERAASDIVLHGHEFACRHASRGKNRLKNLVALLSPNAQFLENWKVKDNAFALK